MTNTILHGDCIEKIRELPDNSVDSVVTDPPYELGFMGKSWDNTGIANNKEMWAECLRVLKPGGHLLAFSGTRTYHRMASAIEDAGFEVRDMIEWVYGSGFPKSLNIGKSIESKMLTGNASKNGFHKLDGEKREGRIGMYDTVEEQGFRKVNPDQLGAFDLEPTTDEAKLWNGWGTALKPAHEPICMARKPLAEKTVAENCLKWGTGGINIDESRVAANWKEERPESWFNSGKSKSGNPTYDGNLKSLTESTVGERLNDAGRFPANLIHDNSEEVRECFPDTKSKGHFPSNNKNGNSIFNTNNLEQEEQWLDDSGNASRFFKSIKKDLHCSLCYDTIDPYQLTKNICNNTNVNNVEKSSETTQATIESTALKNATGQVNENLVQNVKYAGNLCDLCGISIAQRLVAIMQDQSQESTLGELSMPEPKKQILEKCLASFVELRGNTDTIPTMENLNLLFGYVLNAIEEYTQKCEDTKSEDKNQWKSLIYKSKASKSERNRGCEGLEEGEVIRQGLAGEHNNPIHKNNHPTVKPIALMEYLIKMVTPEGGIVLDPFAGSGSTLVAAKQNGYQYIGIEMTEEYIPIIEARLK